MESITPLTPHEFCFKRDKFLRADFSVDAFLQDLWNVTSLDNLRDDLGMYLKLLRSSMIELINKDYADFVNLSGNLIGLDKAIANIEEELTIVLSSIKIVDVFINESCQKMLITMLENQNLEEASLLIEYLRSIPSILSLLEAHLSMVKEHESNSCHMSQENSGQNSCISLKHLTRAADRHNNLQYLCFQCLNTKITSNEVHQRVKEAEGNLLSHLQSAFLRAHEQNDIPSLGDIVNIFSSLDKFSFLTDLLRSQIVAPTFRSIFNSTQLSMDPFDLCGLMGRAKSFVASKLLPIIEIFQRWDNSVPIDIVGTCVLPELYETLKNQLKIIFLHNDPDLFHKRFKCTMEFLEYLEEISYNEKTKDSSIKSKSDYAEFLSLWNIPVYFQLRYQELAGALESCLLRPFLKSSVQSGAHYFNTTDVLLAVLPKCFDSSIYLEPFAYRFWKLFLQLLSRHQIWYSIIISKQLQAFENQPWTQHILSSEAPKSFIKTQSLKGPTTDVSPKLDELVQLYLDIRAIVRASPIIFDSITFPKSFVEDRSCLEGALRISLAIYDDALLPNIGCLIACKLASDSINKMRPVSDIPRLYRYTNKEAPTKCSAYIEEMVAPFQNFFDQNAKRGDFIRNWLKLGICVVSQQYHSAVDSVLTSVYKTLESLKRLRKDRSSVQSQGSSDDEKIRMQLAIDVRAFIDLISPMVTDDLKEICSLRELVADHTKQGSPSE